MQEYAPNVKLMTLILLEVFETLVENSVFKADTKPARNIEDFRKMFVSQIS